jgi:molybdopterin/thiamine biosynthesis adenylyltransferase
MGTDRFARQSRLVPQEKLIGCGASVIGVGAVGRQVALQLACIGVRQLQLIDFDLIELTNVTTQGYRDAEVGAQKVDAAAQAVWEIDPGIAVETIPDRYRPSISLHKAIFVCVDKIESRASLWRAGGQQAEFLVDGRLLGETARVIAVGDPESRAHYPRTLFPAAEAQPGSCGAKGAVFVAAVVTE